jgi:hypothetical protein
MYSTKVKSFTQKIQTVKVPRKLCQDNRTFRGNPAREESAGVPKVGEGGVIVLGEDASAIVVQNGDGLDRPWNIKLYICRQILLICHV